MVCVDAVLDAHRRWGGEVCGNSHVPRKWLGHRGSEGFMQASDTHGTSSGAAGRGVQCSEVERGLTVGAFVPLLVAARL